MRQTCKGNFKIKAYLYDGSNMKQCFHFVDRWIDIYWSGSLYHYSPIRKLIHFNFDSKLMNAVSRELFLYFLNRQFLSLLQVSSLAVSPWFCSEVRGCFWVSERTWAHPAGRGSRKLSLPSSAALWLTIDKARWRSFIQTLHETIVRSGFSHKWIYLRHWVCDCERSLNEARRIRLAWSDLLLF